MRAHSNHDYDSDFDPAVQAAMDGDMIGLASYLSEGDTYRKDTLGLSVPGMAELQVLLLARGLGIGEETRTTLCVFPAAACRICARPRAIDPGIAAEMIADAAPGVCVCASEQVSAAAAEPGAVPEVAVDEGEHTADACQLCLKAVAGPPVFCCKPREALWKKLHGPDARIKQCPRCRGLGQGRNAFGSARPCEACKGTGVEL